MFESQVLTRPAAAGSDSGDSGGRHPVLAVLDTMDTAFEHAHGADAAALNDDDLAAAIRRVHAMAAKQSELFARLVAESDVRDLGRRMGASSSAAWLRDVLNLRPGTAKACLDLGHRLTPPADAEDFAANVKPVKTGRTMPATLAGMVDGEISYDHAVIIARTMARIPTDVSTEDTARAEEDLAAFARQFDPATLQRLADHLLHVLSSESLETREERAHRKRSLRFVDRGDGTVRVSGLLGTEAAAVVRTALDPLAAPEPEANGERDERSPDQRMADALVELARRHLAGDSLPTQHGHPAQLLLLANLTTLLGHDTSEDSGNDHGSARGCRRTDAEQTGAGNGDAADDGATDYEAADDGDGARAGDGDGVRAGDGGVFVVRGCPHKDTPPRWLQDTWARRFGVAPAELTWGGPISSESLRRIACDADVTTVLVDEHGVPLRVGRNERLVTPGIFTALIARDRGCAFPGCTRPPAWTHAHHIRHWADGGPTDLENLVLLCGHHHRVVHHGGWDVRRAPDGHPEFLPPAWVDPDRKPRRNTRPRHDHQAPPDRPR